jgi:hypothetical protein
VKVKATYLLLLILFSSLSLAEDEKQIPDIVDFMRYSAARVNGRLVLHSDLKLNETTASMVPGKIVTSVRANREIRFGFNNHAIRINSKNGIQISVAGMKVDITDLGYDDKTKQFSVKTKVLGIVRSPRLEQKIASILEQRFKTKLHEATKLLEDVRKQKTVGGAQEVLMSILNIFKEGSGPVSTFPDFHGAVTLEAVVPANQTVKVRLAQADLEKNQTIYSTMDFHRTKNKTQIDALRFYAPSQITFRSLDNNNRRSIKSAKIRGVALTPQNGLLIDGTNGGDSLLSTAVTLVAVIGNAAQMKPVSEKDCVDISLVQEMLDKDWKGNLKDYILQNRERLLASGYSPSLLNALIHAPSTAGLNPMEFQPVDNSWLE